jgi:tripeptide aminopeptidase
MNQARLLERFLRYVRVDTTAVEGADSYPSSSGQWELGRMLLDELTDMGIDDVHQDEHGIVLATLPGNVDGQVPTIAFCAHLDTSPETTGRNVNPQVHENYPGGELVLPGDPGCVLRPEEQPALHEMVGRTLITGDGTTLLGADDKAGVAVIIEAVHWWVEHPELPHGPVRICFTCDEEIGRGVDHLHPERIGATACYTLDGQGADTIDVETFSADVAVVRIQGKNIHPSIAKDRMINAVRAAGHFLQALPRDHLSPETTEGRQGFLHPYQIEGGVDEVRLRVLLRDFETGNLTRHAERVREAAAATEAAFAGAGVEVEVRRQYRNMAEGLARDPRAVEYAEEALKRLGRTPQRTLVRGGTDGSRLTELGLPTPNLSCGQHTPHSLLEWACLEEMVGAGQWLLSLGATWAEAK